MENEARLAIIKKFLTDNAIRGCQNYILDRIGYSRHTENVAKEAVCDALMTICMPVGEGGWNPDYVSELTGRPVSPVTYFWKCAVTRARDIGKANKRCREIPFVEFDSCYDDIYTELRKSDLSILNGIADPIGDALHQLESFNDSKESSKKDTLFQSIEYFLALMAEDGDLDRQEKYNIKNGGRIFKAIQELMLDGQLSTEEVAEIAYGRKNDRSETVAFQKIQTVMGANGHTLSKEIWKKAMPPFRKAFLMARNSYASASY